MKGTKEQVTIRYTDLDTGTSHDHLDTRCVYRPKSRSPYISWSGWPKAPGTEN